MVAVATITTILTIGASGVAIYQFYAYSSTDDIVEHLQNIDASIRGGILSTFPDEEIRNIVKKLQGTTQIAAEEAASKGVKDLPAVYLEPTGIVVKRNDSAEFQTPSGKVSTFGVYGVSSYKAQVYVDGELTNVSAGSVENSRRDESCSFLVGELNDHEDTVRVRLVCSKN
jgi:hypothetical protein